MRDYGREIIANTAYREEFFLNIDNAIESFKASGNYEAVVSFKTIRNMTKEYIDLIEG